MVDTSEFIALASSAVASGARVRAVVPDTEILQFCHDLARDNMAGYLARRGRHANTEQWFANAKICAFYLIEHHGTRVGFMSTWANRYSTPSVHIGDLQIAPGFRNRGFGSFALETLAASAATNGDHAVTLNVFFDNPALALYQRHGFEPISAEDDKIRMRKFLC